MEKKFNQLNLSFLIVFAAQRYKQLEQVTYFFIFFDWMGVRTAAIETVLRRKTTNDELLRERVKLG